MPSESGPGKSWRDTLVGIVRFLKRDVLGTLVPAVLVALIINAFLAQATVVRGQSMEPSLLNEQRLVVEKITYGFFHGPRRGDIVVLDIPGQSDLLIKRVVALPGETGEVRDGVVYVDGQPLDEPWATRQGGPDYPPTLVPPLHVFVLGDNRGNSNDSRSFGPVMIDWIVGRAWFIYWPPRWAGMVH